ncbi:MAG: tRNA (adenosine(37)-N6)-threonylcarbamoyltransferase complex ATPase subunit type 1 TsaE [Cyclobacteriaceae bacterium]|nr:tRNA (adenosine(37)-N6)-threonylcarbamoyltransferase complex ATPase subunit type 1 TsaE [Cyclobacteriaceae bacterium]MCH8515566.1 tRNA (adenosine(37)-N6)-threonylcarbamoyltransferase complex ATPase subunit type 1 TsaE [Cyclobacteriaceae bacterium]
MEELRLSYDLSEISDVASKLIEYASSDTIFLFEGSMGAGKTTLIQAIVQTLGYDDRVSSPTYGLVNEYPLDGGHAIYHFDFYRIEDIEEAEDIGIYEYFDSGDICLVEWPSKIEALWPEAYVKVHLSKLENEDKKRELRAHKYYDE